MNLHRPLILSLVTLLAPHLSAASFHDLPPPRFNHAADNGSLGSYPTKSFVTQEDIRAPIINFLTWSPSCDDGLHYFITPRGHSLEKPGPMILDSRGEMIWGHHFENSFGGQAYDFMVQQYQGQDYLTFWLGDDRVRGHGAGAYYMLNASYDIVKKVKAGNGFSADLHEFLITHDDTALMSIYEVVPGDVTRYRTFDPEEVPEEEQNFVWDCLFQEVDLRTDELLFEWRASDHVEIDETFRDIYTGGTKEDPWDWFHINSVEKDEFGNYLISARYPHSMMYIDGRTKETIWQLGGKQNDFLDVSAGQALNFAWQHDARFFPTNTFPDSYEPPPERDGYVTRLLTLFDNAAEDQHYKYGVDLARGMVLELTYPTPGSAKAKEKTRVKPTGSIRTWDAPAKKDGVDMNALKVEYINGTDPAWTVRLIKSYENPATVRSSSQGSMQIVPQANHGDPRILLGYGLNAVFTEFDANGTVLCDVRYGAKTSWDRGDIQSYRIYKMGWTGRPEWRPAIEISDDDVEIYVSWMGATDVVDWVLQCADTASSRDAAWSDVVRIRKTGFETIITVPTDLGDSRYLRVIALASDNRRLDYGISDTIDRGVVAAYFPALNHKIPDDFAQMPRTKVFLVVVLNVSLFIFLYELYRRCLGRRHRRSAVVGLPWRKDSSQMPRGLLVDA